MLQRDRMELAAIVATCRDCQATRECRAHLADPSRLVDEADFCPNHAEYSFLADQRIT
jgi:hypothetical protein